MSSLAGLPNVLATIVVVVVVCVTVEATTKLTCDNVRCGWGATCTMRAGKPVCECNEICMDLYKPVCGSDGKTYSNECYLQRAACQGKVSISVASQGECSQRPSSSTKRPCQSVCPAIYKPVCGSDHKEYGNECSMNVAACKSGRKITKLNEGGCETFAPTTTTVRPKCEDQVCTAEYKPVCSSDNVTYENDCELEKAICRSGGKIRKEYEGVCETFAPTPGPQNCKRCPKGPYLPVCGSNGITYANKCELERAACLEQRRITKEHDGGCDETTTKCAQCPPGSSTSTSQVCGSDNKTYRSRCELKRTACLEQRNISLKFERPCGKIKVCPTKNYE